VKLWNADRKIVLLGKHIYSMAVGPMRDDQPAAEFLCAMCNKMHISHWLLQCVFCATLQQPTTEVQPVAGLHNRCLLQKSGVIFQTENFD